MLHEALFDYLSGAGTTAGNRIYPQQLPLGVTLPAIRYAKVSDPSEATMTGPSTLRHPRYQFDCFADGDDAYNDATTLANEVQSLLDGYSGLMKDVTVNAGLQQDSRDNFDAETGRRWVSVDVVIWYTNYG
jgi:hypothetical protein